MGQGPAPTRRCATGAWKIGSRDHRRRLSRPATSGRGRSATVVLKRCARLPAASGLEALRRAIGARAGRGVRGASCEGFFLVIACSPARNVEMRAKIPADQAAIERPTRPLKAWTIVRARNGLARGCRRSAAVLGEPRSSRRM